MHSIEKEGDIMQLLFLLKALHLHSVTPHRTLTISTRQLVVEVVGHGPVAQASVNGARAQCYADVIKRVR
jgi:hypothetical protein